MLYQEWDPDALYWNNMMLSGIMYNHERKIYNYITLIGDLGGVREIFTALIAFFIMPISTY
jgi:hypothetical protein